MATFGENEEISPHTINKKWKFLRKYLEAYTIIMSNKTWNRFFYIDGFAGAGKYGDYDGSPLIALKIKYPFTDYIFIEDKKEIFDKLVSNVNQTPKRKAKIYRNWTKPPEEVDINISLKNDNVNPYLQKNLCSIVPKGTICFIFLDPAGIELDMKTLEVCSKKEKVELLINFPVSGVVRNIGIPQNEKTITSLYGSDKWKEVNSKDNRKGEKLADIYLKGLKECFKNIDYKVITNERNTPVYYLIFATNSDVGFKIMKNVMQDGQRTLISLLNKK